MRSVKTIVRISLGAALGLLSVACSGGDPPEPLELPGCLRDLLAPCAPEGACVTPPMQGGANVCFETGVRVSRDDVGDSATCRTVARVSKADGTLCYTYEFMAGVMYACELAGHTWKDAAGNVVATAHSSAYPNWGVTITCAATGDIAACGGSPSAPSSNSCCAISDYGAAACTAAGVAHSSCTAGSCPGAGGTGGSGGTGGGGGGDSS